jgi:hypothetical protein
MTGTQHFLFITARVRGFSYRNKDIEYRLNSHKMEICYEKALFTSHHNFHNYTCKH